MKMGLLGGTFDPVHMGHLDVARAAQRALSLDHIWLVPSRVPPHRGQTLASAEDRFAMAVLAAADEPAFSVSDLDMSGPGPWYTHQTLDRLEARDIPLSSVFFITGADAFRLIATWRGYPDILDRCHFVAVSRAETRASALPGVLPDLSRRMHQTPCEVGTEPGIFLVDAPTAPVSSTEVRRAAAAGLPLEGLVPPSVAGYIRQRKLYEGSRLNDEGTA